MLIACKTDSVDRDVSAMTLKLYPTGLSEPDLQDQAVRSGEWQIGRIWQYRDGSGDLIVCDGGKRASA